MGIEIYSQVGKKIYEITSEKKRVYDNLNESLRDIVLLTPEEIAAIEGERTQFKQEQTEVRKRHTSAKAMQDAMQQITALETQKPALVNEYCRLCAAFDATIAQLEEKKTKLEELNKNIADEAPNSAMYAAIGQIKSLMGKRHKALENIDIFTQAWQQEKNNLPKAEEAVKQKRNACQTQKEQVQAKQEQYNSLNIDQVNTRKDALTDCKAALKTIKGQIETIANQETAVGEMKGDLKDQQELLTRESATLELKKTLAQKAHDELERHKDWSALLTQARKSLRQGDPCPVCGHVIDTLLTPSSQSVLDELQAQYQEADQDWKATQTRITASEKLIGHLKQQLKKAENELETRRNTLEAQRADTLQLQERCGMASRELSTIEQIDATIAAIDGEVEQLNATLVEAQKLMKALQQEHKKYNDAETAYHNAVIAMNNVKNSIEKQATAIATSQSQYNEVTAELDQLLAIEGWQQLTPEQATQTVDDIESRAKRYQQMTTQAGQLEQDIALTKTSIPVMEEAKRNISDLSDSSAAEGAGCRVDGDNSSPLTLNALVSRWNALENSYLQWQTALRREQVAFKEAQQQLDCLLEAQPALKMERIEDIISQTGQHDEQLNEEISLRTARLKADEENRRLAGKKREQLADAEAVYSQWSRLNEMLGNADGAKFRKIALSYILDELLTIANQYLNRFNDRYELEAQPGSLTILVRDLLQGDKTAVTTLSGGESFMVSLALALALARMTGKVFTVDTIFIDEGFGTLSEGYLTSVMETLNHLYDLGGRRVGIISHVEALKERIATQIHVERDPRNNTVSHISVTG